MQEVTIFADRTSRIHETTQMSMINVPVVQIYNVSHLLGFASLFNGSAIYNIEVYKGVFSVRCGGRTSSVLDFSIKEGNMHIYHTFNDISIAFMQRFYRPNVMEKNGTVGDLGIWIGSLYDVSLSNDYIKFLLLKQNTL